MSKVFSISLNTFRESIRDKILLSLGIFGFILIAASKIFVPISIGQAPRIIRDFGINVIELFGLFIVVLIGTRILYNEIERKTIYTLITKPVKNWEFVTGKFLGLYYLIIAVQVILFAIFLIFNKIYLHSIDWYMLNTLFFFLFEFLLLDAIAVFFSCFTTPITAAILTVLTFFIGNMTHYLREFVEVAHLYPLKGLMDFLYYALPNFSVFNVKPSVVHHLPISPCSYFLAFSYSLLYSIILILLSSLLYSIKEYY